MRNPSALHWSEIIFEKHEDFHLPDLFLLIQGDSYNVSIFSEWF